MLVKEENFTLDLRVTADEWETERDEHFMEPHAWAIFDYGPDENYEAPVPGMCLYFETHGPKHLAYQITFTEQDILGMLADIHALKKIRNWG